jgi:hypothetical protein
MKFCQELKCLLLFVHSLGQGVKNEDFFRIAIFWIKKKPAPNCRLKYIKFLRRIQGNQYVHNDGIALN